MSGRRKAQTRAERLVAAIAALSDDELKLWLVRPLLKCAEQAREPDQHDAAHERQGCDHGLGARHA